MYLAMWFVTSQRNMAGFFKGLLVIMLVMFAPAREIRDLTVTLHVESVADRDHLVRVRRRLPAVAAIQARCGRTKSRTFRRVPAGDFRAAPTGREFDLMLGTSNPWLLVAALIATARARDPLRARRALGVAVLPHHLQTVTGAFSGQAAERSRALWLRGDWSRAALFTAVERSVWRHNGLVLGVLMLFSVGHRCLRATFHRP